MPAQLKGAFHYRDGWHWRRGAEGQVEIYKSRPDGSDAELVLVIDDLSWASIVCSVSAGGETSERWNAARDFHSKTS